MSTLTARPPVSTVSPRAMVNTAVDRLADVLTAHSITILRVSLGLVFLVFASFKFVAGALVGILSPLVLFPGQMWADNGPTLTGQYVFKDLVLVAGGLVVAAHTLGARMRRG